MSSWCYFAVIFYTLSLIHFVPAIPSSIYFLNKSSILSPRGLCMDCSSSPKAVTRGIPMVNLLHENFAQMSHFQGGFS